MISNGYGFETNNTDYKIYGTFCLGSDNISNSDYAMTTIIGQSVIGTTNNTDYQTGFGFYSANVSEGEAAISANPITGNEIFNDNVYADKYETINITLSLNPAYSNTYTFNYNIPYNIDDVNISSMHVQNMSGDNVSFTYSDGIIIVIADGSQDPYYITYGVKTVKKMTKAEYGDCPTGWQEYANYCLLMTSTESAVTYNYQYFMNVSRNETNQSHILHNQSTSTFTNFGSRNSLSVNVNGSSINTTANVISNVLQYNISNTHNNDYGLNEGIYYLEVIYDVSAPAIPAPGGGSPSGDADIDDTYGPLYDIISGARNITAYDFKVPKLLNYSITIGTIIEKQILIENLGNTSLKLMASTICLGNETMCNWNWFFVNGKKSNNKLIELEPYETKNLTLYTLPYAELGSHNMLIEFNKIDTNATKYTIVTQTIQLMDITEKTMQIWQYEIWSSNYTVPYIQKNRLTMGDLAIISFVLSLIAVLIILKSNKKKRR